MQQQQPQQQVEGEEEIEMEENTEEKAGAAGCGSADGAAGAGNAGGSDSGSGGVGAAVQGYNALAHARLSTNGIVGFPIRRSIDRGVSVRGSGSGVNTHSGPSAGLGGASLAREAGRGRDGSGMSAGDRLGPSSGVRKTLTVALQSSLGGGRVKGLGVKSGSSAASSMDGRSSQKTASPIAGAERSPPRSSSPVAGAAAALAAAAAAAAGEGSRGLEARRRGGGAVGAGSVGLGGEGGSGGVGVGSEGGTGPRIRSPFQTSSSPGSVATVVVQRENASSPLFPLGKTRATERADAAKAGVVGVAGGDKTAKSTAMALAAGGGRGGGVGGGGNIDPTGEGKGGGGGCFEDRILRRRVSGLDYYDGGGVGGSGRRRLGAANITAGATISGSSATSAGSAAADGHENNRIRQVNMSEASAGREGGGGGGDERALEREGQGFPMQQLNRGRGQKEEDMPRLLRPRVGSGGHGAGGSGNAGGTGGGARGISGMGGSGRRPALGADGKRSSAGRVSGSGSAFGSGNGSGNSVNRGERGNLVEERGYTNHYSDGGGGDDIGTVSVTGDIAESAFSGRSGGEAGMSMGAAEGLVAQGIATFDPFSFSQKDAAFVNGETPRKALTGGAGSASALSVEAAKKTALLENARNTY